MTLTLVLLATVLVVAAILGPTLWRSIRGQRGVHALPHRPAPGTPPPPGPRHRAAAAHTASYSAAAVLAAQRARQATAMPRATRQQRRDANRATT